MKLVCNEIYDLLDAMGLTLWSVLLDSGAIWIRLRCKVLSLTSDQIIWVSKKMSTFYYFYKSDKEEPDDKWD